MSQYISIPLINEHIQKKEAQDLAKKIINSDEIISINPFYYPYYHYNVNCKLPFLFGGKRITINALIDACSGQGLTTDEFGLAKVVIPKEQMLDIKKQQVHADIALKSFIVNHLQRKFRTFFDYKTTVENRSVIYKLFWMIEYATESVLIDSFTEDFEILDIKKRA